MKVQCQTEHRHHPLQNKTLIPHRALKRSFQSFKMIQNQPFLNLIWLVLESKNAQLDKLSMELLIKCLETLELNALFRRCGSKLRDEGEK